MYKMTYVKNRTHLHDRLGWEYHHTSHKLSEIWDHLDTATCSQTRIGVVVVGGHQASVFKQMLACFIAIMRLKNNIDIEIHF